MSVGRSSVLTPVFWGTFLWSAVFATPGEILGVADRKRKLLCGDPPSPQFPTPLNWSFNLGTRLNVLMTFTDYEI